MLRRPPTKIELKLDDVQEYEKAKREAEARRARANIFASCSSPSTSANTTFNSDDAKSKTEVIMERIGMDPKPKKPH